MNRVIVKALAGLIFDLGGPLFDIIAEQKDVAGFLGGQAEGMLELSLSINFCI
jgi:hypothetical protein